MRLHKKLFIPFLLIVMVPVLMVGGFAYNYIVSNTKTTLINSVNQITDSIAPRINERLLGAQTNLKLFASSRLLQDYIKRGDERYGVMQPSIMRQFSEYQYVFPDYYAIQLLLENGEVDSVVDSRAATAMQFDRSDWSFFQYLKNQPTKEMTVQSMVEHDLVGNKIVHFAKPLLITDDGSNISPEVIGQRRFLIISMYLDYIANILETLHQSNDHLFFVLDSDDHLLFSRGQQVQTLFDSSAVKAVVNVNEIAQGRFKINDSDIDYFLSARPLAFGLQLYAGLPTAEFTKSANELVWRLAAILVTIILFILLFNILYIRRLLLQPIYAIQALVHDITLGNLDSRLSFRFKQDELGDLSNNILDMRARIEENNNKIEKLAFYDDLTELPNRLSLKHSLDSLISRKNQEQREFALVFLDLDNFKNINDTLGHDVGDLLLIKASERINKILERANDRNLACVSDGINYAQVFRLGGDEFTVIFPDFSSLDTLEWILAKIIKSLSSPFLIKGKEMAVGASIGVAIYPHHGGTAKELLKSADMAMYEAKHKGKNCYTFFDQDMNARVLASQQLESALRVAQQNQQFSLAFQPRININNFTVDGFEALIRWQHPSLGNIPPDQFIPLAETNLQILDIGRWVLQEACQKIKKWTQAGHTDFKIAINVSPIQFQREDMFEVIQDVLNEQDISGEYLEIEVTESALLHDEAETIAALQKIRKLGVRVALDDFGTGYSSLSYLRRLPIDILKIDRSFISDILHCKDSAAIFETIVQLARKLDLYTVAEGVETAQQHELMLLTGCDHAQGYYYSPPLGCQQADIYMLKSEQAKLMLAIN